MYLLKILTSTIYENTSPVTNIQTYLIIEICQSKIFPIKEIKNNPENHTIKRKTGKIDSSETYTGHSKDSIKVNYFKLYSHEYFLKIRSIIYFSCKYSQRVLSSYWATVILISTYFLKILKNSFLFFVFCLIILLFYYFSSISCLILLNYSIYLNFLPLKFLFISF